MEIDRVSCAAQPPVHFGQSVKDIVSKGLVSQGKWFLDSSQHDYVLSRIKLRSELRSQE